MQTRIIEQILIFKLNLNRMTSPKIEMLEMAAWSFDMEELVKLLESERAESPYTDGNWNKIYKKGSILEWFNPPFHEMISSEWIEKETVRSLLSLSEFNCNFVGKKYEFE